MKCLIMTYCTDEFYWKGRKTSLILLSHFPKSGPGWMFLGYPSSAFKGATSGLENRAQLLSLPEQSSICISHSDKNELDQ